MFSIIILQVFFLFLIKLYPVQFALLDLTLLRHGFSFDLRRLVVSDMIINIIRIQFHRVIGSAEIQTWQNVWLTLLQESLLLDIDSTVVLHTAHCVMEFRAKERFYDHLLLF